MRRAGGWMPFLALALATALVASVADAKAFRIGTKLSLDRARAEALR